MYCLCKCAERVRNRMNNAFFKIKKSRYKPSGNIYSKFDTSSLSYLLLGRLYLDLFLRRNIHYLVQFCKDKLKKKSCI